MKPARARALPDPEVEKLIDETLQRLGRKKRVVSDDEILERMMYPMINEGARILEEGVAARPSDIDVIWLYGYGWPIYRGGPMFYADQVGLKHIADRLSYYAKETNDPSLEPAPLLKRLAAEGKTFASLAQTRKRLDGDEPLSPRPSGERQGEARSHRHVVRPHSRLCSACRGMSLAFVHHAADMTHPGEQFYPQGVHWDDPIARGTLPDLLSAAAAEFGARPALEFRDRPISYAELEALVETAAAAFLRAGYGKNTSVALFLGNSPDHPVNFFGALKAGARIVHLSPLDGEIALSHKLSRLRRARARHQQPVGAAADRAEISRQGPARSPDRLRGRSLGQGRHAADGAAG